MRFGNTRHPYEQRTHTFTPDKLRNDPQGVIKQALWTLIMSNCLPGESKTETFTARKRKTPVQDVTVQTFYISYPTGLESKLGHLSGEKIAAQIIEEIVSNPIFEPYLIDKIGKSNWETVKNQDSTNAGYTDRENKPIEDRIAEGDFKSRLEAASNIRLVEVFVYADPKATRGGLVRVVGRESRAVEVTRLRQSGNDDPAVIAVINVDGKAYVNPHLREYQEMNDAQRRSRNRPIYILEGRNAHEFIIGPHHYDDIEVPGMRNESWYALTINSAQGFSVTATLSDDAGQLIAPEPNQTGILRWGLKSNARGENWTCTLLFTKLSRQRLSFFQDAMEVPPSVLLVGRVLPRSTAIRPYQPEPLKEYLRSIPGVDLASGVTLEEDLYLYSIAPNDDVYLYDKKGNKNIIVEDSQGNVATPTQQGFKLDDLSRVTIGKKSYTWHSYQLGSLTLPAETVGLLEDENKEREVIETPINPDDPNQWMLGNWRQGASSATGIGCTPIFFKNPDLLLGRGGNLIFKYNDRDAQSRPQLGLVLRKVKNQLLFAVKTTSDAHWRSIHWPQFGNSELFEIDDVVIVGERNDLIFGTCYYRIQTSTTLSS